jgi:glycosyltransferase involved in cell wall biosynthesis
MRNILVFTTTFPTFLEGDGTPPFVYELSKRLAEKEDINIIVLTPFRKKTKVFEERDGLKIYRFKYGFTSLCEGAILPNLKKNKFLYFQIPFLFLFSIINLAKVIKKENINIIHAHWIIPQGFIAVLYKKLFRKKSLKIICTSHGGDIFGLQNSLMKKIKRWTLNNIDGLTVVSNAIKDEVQKLNIRKDLPIEVISMGVDTELFNPDKYDPKIKEKYNIKGPFLLFVGRLVEKKGVKYLIDAIPKVIEKYPETKLLIVGSGPLENELKTQVKNLNLEKNIIFTGAIPNNELPRYYATADIFIGPSIITKGGDREGLPVTYLEAMSSGCIVIGTDLLGNKDVIKEGINGYVIKQKNSKDIEDKILEILGNKTKKIEQKMVLDFIRGNFSWNIISKKYSEILK